MHESSSPVEALAVILQVNVKRLSHLTACSATINLRHGNAHQHRYICTYTHAHTVTLRDYTSGYVRWRWWWWCRWWRAKWGWLRGMRRWWLSPQAHVVLYFPSLNSAEPFLPPSALYLPIHSFFPLFLHSIISSISHSNLYLPALFPTPLSLSPSLQPLHLHLLVFSLFTIIITKI